MNHQRYALPAIMIGGVLVLLAAAAWYHDHPRKAKPLPVELTRPDPNIDRSRIPLGPYTVDFSGLIGGPTGVNGVTFHVVMMPGDVHFQRIGEVGKTLKNRGVVSVNGLGIQYHGTGFSNRRNPFGDVVDVDGLRMRADSLATYPEFEILSPHELNQPPIRVICSLGDAEREVIARTHSFKGIKHGSCSALFYPKPYLDAYLRAIQPAMMPNMAKFLPIVLEEMSHRINGDP